MAKPPRTEPITPQGIRRELGLYLDKKRLDSATRIAVYVGPPTAVEGAWFAFSSATRITVYVGPPPSTPEPDEKRFFLSRFGAHVGVFLPRTDAAKKAGER